MARVIKELTNMEIDEISLVDRPANSHARVVIAKRATEEDDVPGEIYNEDGLEVDPSTVDAGDVVFADDGEAFVVVEDDAAEYEYEDEYEPVGKGYAEELREELSKSLTNIERDDVISKALGQVDDMRYAMEEAEVIAKSERDLRLTGDYEIVAKNYNLPVDSEDLAPVLLAIAEELPYEYGAVIHKALSAAGEILFDEVGAIGYATNNDVLDSVDHYIDENISKGEEISKSEAVSAVFDANPEAYDEYMATRY